VTATRGACGRSAALRAQAPALYDVEVRHVRHAALHRDFRHRVYLWLVDLDALPRLPLWLRPFAGFRAADHLGDPDGTIRGNLDRYLAGRGIDLRGGRVLMLANARVLGYVFNPLTVFWCHGSDGSLACVVAEVHNTYGERHCYLLATDHAGRARAMARGQYRAERWVMPSKTVVVALNGVTGRMGYNQHLVRSLLAIREQGGVLLPDGTSVIPEPVLVGRNEEKLRAIAERHGLPRWTTSLDEVLADPSVSVYFDTQITSEREPALLRAIAAGKHVYTEKPVAASLDGAVRVARAARAAQTAGAGQTAGVVHGVVQDKLFLPGMIKLRRLVRDGFLGRVLAIRLEFGYWVFDGEVQPAQRPSWNYRREQGGGIVLDMFPHWQYLLAELFGPVTAVYARQATHLPRRWDEQGQPYDATADDAAYAILEFASGAVASVNSSWAVRVNRRELVELQVDGTAGSAVAGLRHCAVQPAAVTPRPVWNPDLPDPADYRSQWADVPDNQEFANGFKAQWELFLQHAATGKPFPWDLAEGARGVQLAEAALRSAAEGRRVEIPDLPL